MNVTSVLSLSVKIDSAYTVLCRKVLKEFKISQTSFDILMFLRNNPDQYTARDISKLKNIKPNVVSLHVDEMVNDGYLERQNVEGDRRKVKLVYTEKAVPIIKRGHEIQKEFLKSLLNGLTENDLEGFMHCFNVISENADIIQARRVKRGENNV